MINCCTCWVKLAQWLASFIWVCFLYHFQWLLINNDVFQDEVRIDSRARKKKALKPYIRQKLANKLLVLGNDYEMKELEVWLIWFSLKPYSEELFLYKPWRTKDFIKFEYIINVLASSFWFIWISLLWVYDLWKYFYSYSVGIDFSRQNLTSTDVRFWRLKLIPNPLRMKAYLFKVRCTYGIG